MFVCGMARAGIDYSVLPTFWRVVFGGIVADINGFPLICQRTGGRRLTLKMDKNDPFHGTPDRSASGDEEIKYEIYYGKLHALKPGNRYGGYHTDCRTFKI